LDALCKRYGVDNSQRDLHGALLDSEILADVYLLMTGGQTALELASDAGGNENGQIGGAAAQLVRSGKPLNVVRANETELIEHQKKLQEVAGASGDNCLWGTD